MLRIEWPTTGSGIGLAVCGVLFAAVIWVAMCATLPAVAQESTAQQYKNKATFLAAFPSFVEWPESAFPSTESPFVICVRGDFSFGTSLAELARGKSPHGRRVEVRWVHKDQDLRSCQIAFISRSELKRYAKLLQALEGAWVLTVGETDDFLMAGGAISLSSGPEALQFEVNLAATEAAHLKISSRLLALARRVMSRTEAAKG